jgi:hypothetical protein
MAQAVSRQPVTAETRVRFQASPLENDVDQVTLGHVLLDYFRFPCQYHSHPGSTAIRSSTADTVQPQQLTVALTDMPNEQTNSPKDTAHCAAQ